MREITSRTIMVEAPQGGQGPDTGPLPPWGTVWLIPPRSYHFPKVDTFLRYKSTRRDWNTERQQNKADLEWTQTLHQRLAGMTGQDDHVLILFFIINIPKKLQSIQTGNSTLGCSTCGKSHPLVAKRHVMVDGQARAVAQRHGAQHPDGRKVFLGVTIKEICPSAKPPSVEMFHSVSQLLL